MCSFQEKVFLLCPYDEKIATLQIAHGSFLIFCLMVFLPNINFFISKANKPPKIDPKKLKNRLVLLLLDMSYLLQKQSKLCNQT